MRLGIQIPAATPTDRVRVVEVVLFDSDCRIFCYYFPVSALAAAPRLVVPAICAALACDVSFAGLALVAALTTNEGFVGGFAHAALCVLVPFEALSAEAFGLAGAIGPSLAFRARLGAPAIGSADGSAGAFAPVAKAVPGFVVTAGG